MSMHFVLGSAGPSFEIDVQPYVLTFDTLTMAFSTSVQFNCKHRYVTYCWNGVTVAAHTFPSQIERNVTCETEEGHGHNLEISINLHFITITK